MSKSDYKVGYGKPPIDSQFKPGKSGNPQGRPKESRNWQTIINEELTTRIDIQINGKAKTVTKREAVFMALTNKAIKGDVRAMQAVISLMSAADNSADDEATLKSLNEQDQEVLNDAMSRIFEKERRSQHGVDGGEDED